MTSENENTNEELETVLNKIKSWDVEKEGMRNLLEYAKSNWCPPEAVLTRGEWYLFPLVILSNNRHIIKSLQENRLFWNLCWELSAPNLHVFRASLYAAVEENPFFKYIEEEEPPCETKPYSWENPNIPQLRYSNNSGGLDTFADGSGPISGSNFEEKK